MSFEKQDLKTIRQGEQLSPYVQIQYQDYDTDTHQELDTRIAIQADITIAGKDLNDFNNELKRLIDKYGI